MILCLGTTPAVQRVMVLPRLNLDSVNRAAATVEGAAGKGVNVAKVLRALGEKPLTMGFLGGAKGKAISNILDSLGIEHEFVWVQPETRQCVTVIDQANGTVTELVEESASVTRANAAQLCKAIQKRLEQCRAVVMSGTIADGCGDGFYRRLIESAKRVGAWTVVDAKGQALRLALEAGPDVIKPNRAELAATVGRALSSEDDVVTAMAELAERGASRVVVTSGAAPTLAWERGKAWRVPVPEIQAVNPIGSGDAFTAGLIWRLLGGDPLGEACRWAGAVGAANALNVMAGEVRKDDLEPLMAKLEPVV